jgi:hypothetical protein
MRYLIQYAFNTSSSFSTLLPPWHMWLFVVYPWWCSIPFYINARLCFLLFALHIVLFHHHLVALPRFILFIYSFSIFGDGNQWRPAPATVNDESEPCGFYPIFIQYIITRGVRYLVILYIFFQSNYVIVAVDLRLDLRLCFVGHPLRQRSHR